MLKMKKILLSFAILVLATATIGASLEDPSILQAKTVVHELTFEYFAKLFGSDEIEGYKNNIRELRQKISDDPAYKALIPEKNDTQIKIWFSDLVSHSQAIYGAFCDIAPLIRNEKVEIKQKSAGVENHISAIQENSRHMKEINKKLVQVLRKKQNSAGLQLIAKQLTNEMTGIAKRNLPFAKKIEKALKKLVAKKVTTITFK